MIQIAPVIDECSLYNVACNEGKDNVWIYLFTYFGEQPFLPSEHIQWRNEDKKNNMVN